MEWCRKIGDGAVAIGTPEWDEVKSGVKINVKFRYFKSAEDGKPYIQPETDIEDQKCLLPMPLDVKYNSVVGLTMVVENRYMNAVRTRFDYENAPVLTILADNIHEVLSEEELEKKVEKK